MIKHILIAVTTALLVLPNLSSTILADPPEVPDDAGRHRPRFSAQDFADGDHFNVSPGEINWGHAGTLAHDELLKRITGAALKEDEHAL